MGQREDRTFHRETQGPRTKKEEEWRATTLPCLLFRVGKVRVYDRVETRNLKRNNGLLMFANISRHPRALWNIIEVFYFCIFIDFIFQQMLSTARDQTERATWSVDDITAVCDAT